MATEKRLIDANALMDAFRSYMVERYDSEKCVSDENCKTCEKSCLWRRIVSVAPTVDAVEVVHARWKNGKCTNCTHYAEVQNIGFTCTGELKVNYKHTNYCPNCGAKMDGDGNG